MAGFLCKCDHLIDFGTIPSPHEWEIVSQTDWFKWNDSGEDSFALQRLMKTMLECPDCGRIWIFRNGFSQPPEMYEPTPF
jgi:hypothetical protein